MIKVENNKVQSLYDLENDNLLTNQIMQAFIEIRDSLFEELKESAELQAKSEAVAMLMPSDSIY